MSESFNPVLANSRRIAGAGPMPMISGGTPATAAATIRAIGFLPLALAYSPEVTTQAAAASTKAELLPPVCTPPSNTVRNLASTSMGEIRGCVS